MTRAVFYLSVLLVAGSALAFLLPLIDSREDWLFITFAVGLVGAIVTRMALDAKPKDPTP